VGMITIVYHHTVCKPVVWDWTGGCMFFIYFVLFIEFFIQKYGNPVQETRLYRRD